MYFALKFAFVCVCLSSAAAANKPFPTDLLRSSEFSLMQFLVDSRALQQEHPQRTMVCFDYYLPLLNTITEEYKERYELCLANALSDRENVDSSTAPEREEIESNAKSSCLILQECGKLSNSIEYFECFVDGGKENSKTMYTISASASETLAVVREQYRLIENQENKCTNASERVYVEQTYEANMGLKSCLKGETPVPTTPKPTTADPVDTTTEEDETTAAPEEATTEEESTVAPEKTSEESNESSTKEESSSENTTEESKTSEESNESSTKEESSSKNTTEESKTSEESSESSTKEESSSENTTEESKTSKESNESSTKEKNTKNSTKEEANESKSEKSENKENSDSNESSDAINEKPEEDKYDNIRNRIAKMRKVLSERML